MLFSISGIFGANTFGHAFLGIANSSMGAVFAGQSRATLEETLKFTKQDSRNGVKISKEKDVRIKLFRMFARVEKTRLFSEKVADYFYSKVTGPVSSFGSSFRSSFWFMSKVLQAYTESYEKYENVRTISKKFTNPEKFNSLMYWGKYGVETVEKVLDG